MILTFWAKMRMDDGEIVVTRTAQLKTKDERCLQAVVMDGHHYVLFDYGQGMADYIMVAGELITMPKVQVAKDMPPGRG